MKLIVYETTGDWAAAIRRNLPSQTVLVETRSLDELIGELGTTPLAVVAFEFIRSRLASSLAAIAQVTCRFPGATIIALADRTMFDHEWIMRESGAAHVVFSRRQVADIADIARQCSAVSVPDDFGARQQLWGQRLQVRMPWS